MRSQLIIFSLFFSFLALASCNRLQIEKPHLQQVDKNKIQYFFDRILIGMDENEILEAMKRKPDKTIGSGVIYDIYFFENCSMIMTIWKSGVLDSKRLFVNDCEMVNMQKE